MIEYELTSQHKEAIMILHECGKLNHEIVDSFSMENLPITEHQIDEVIRERS